jgi:hypothetical protein
MIGPLVILALGVLLLGLLIGWLVGVDEEVEE